MSPVSRQARLWEQRQAAAAKPPSDTASVTRNGIVEGAHEETQLPPVDAQPVTDFLNEVLLELILYTITTSHKWEFMLGNT